MKVFCPYCQSQVPMVDSSIVYRRSYGPIYWCDPCDAYVGVHAGTDKPKGTLAKAPLRQARKQAHAAFDPLWIRPGIDKSKRRGEVYRALAAVLGMPGEECHIGEMNEFQCASVVLACEYGLVEDQVEADARKEVPVG